MARWQVKFQTFSRVRRKFFLAKVFFLRTHEGFAKNAILSCHLAIFVSLIPFLKGVGCRMASENSKSHIRGRAGRNVRRLVFPARPPTCESLQKLHFKLHPTPSFRHLIAQHPLTPIDPYRSSDRKRATVALLSFHCFAWLSLLCLFLVSLNCRRLLSRRFKPKSVIRPPIVILPSYRDFPAPFRFSVHHLVPRFFSP